jgi:hypothetical protein
VCRYRAVAGADASGNVTVGGVCVTSVDCYNAKACLSGTCCNFGLTNTMYSYPGSSNYYDTTAAGNCTNCDYNSTRSSWSNQYTCNACAPGSELYQYGMYVWQCGKICDPATEYRRSSYDSYCTQRVSAGAS